MENSILPTVFFIYSILEHDFLNQYILLLLTTKEFLFKSSRKFLRNVLYILLRATFNFAHAFTFYTHCPMEVLKKSGSVRCYNTLSRYECRFHAARVPRWYAFSSHPLSFSCLLSRGCHAIAKTHDTT